MTTRPDLRALRAALAELTGADIEPDRLRAVRAPGRVNLMGEHTDYNGGYVLPMAIGLETWMASVETDDDRASIMQASSREIGEFDVSDPGPARGLWIDYAAGVAVELAALGTEIRGFRAVVASSLPQEVGLSSSAAFELAAAWTLSAQVPPPLATMDLAQAAQRAENGYVGVRCGIMDQAAVTLGRAGAALLLDCRSFEYRSVPLRLGDHAFVVIDSGSPRRLSSSGYNQRRTECETAVRLLAERVAGVRSLRDVTPAMLEEHASALDEVSRRRAEHVVHENERVLAMAAALERSEVSAAGRLLAESHASLQRLYEVSSPELDALVEIAAGVEGVAGSRLTGAGFGGSTVTLLRRDRFEDLRAAVGEAYARRTGLQARLYLVEPVDGVGLVPLGS